jgi:hypothetical protein
MSDFKNIDDVAKSVWVDDVEEFKNMAEAYKKSGIGIGSDQFLAATETMTGHSGAVIESLGKFKRAGRLFNHVIDTTTRRAAFLTAWKEARKTKSAAELTAPKEVAKLLDTAHALSGDMHAMARNAIGTGPASWLSMFTKWPSNMLQLVTGMAGDRVPPATLKKMWAAGLAMYGASFIPGGGTVMAEITEALDSDGSLSPQVRAGLKSGLVDWASIGLTDHATGSAPGSIIDDFYRKGTQDRGIIGLIPAASKLSEVIENMGDAVGFLSAGLRENIPLDTAVTQAVGEILSSAASMKGAQQSLAILRAEGLANAAGTTIMDMEPTMTNALLHTLGFTHVDELAIRAIGSERVETGKEVEGLVKELEGLYNQMNVTGDISKKAVINARAAAVVKAIESPLVRQRVLEKVRVLIPTQKTQAEKFQSEKSIADTINKAVTNEE